MKKRILIALFVLPLVVLVADKALGLNTPTNQTNSHALQSEGGSEAETAGLEAPAIVRLDKMGTKVQASFVKEFKIWESDEFVGAMQDTFYAMDKIYRYDSEVPEQLEAFLQEEVLRPMEELDIFKIDLEEQFSRCGSQYTFVVQKTTNLGKHGRGVMVKDVGCWERPLAPFEYNLESKQVWVHVNDSLGALTVHDFLLLYKKALNS
jgi:hypothetical protein